MKNSNNSDTPSIVVDLVERSAPLPRSEPSEKAKILRDYAHIGNAEMVREWVSVASEGDLKEEAEFQGRSALALAAAAGHVDCVALLLPHATDRSAHDAIWMAAQKGHAECIRLLEPEKRHPSAAWNAISVAASIGSAECLRLLIPALSSKKWIESAIPLALQNAAGAGSVECLETLLAGMPDEKNDIPRFLQIALNHALIAAAGEGRIDCARFLLARGADPKSQDMDGRTALWFAANGGIVGWNLNRPNHAGHVECTRLLAPVSDAHVAPSAKPGQTPLWMALEGAMWYQEAADCVLHLAPFSDVTREDHAWEAEKGQLVSCLRVAESRTKEIPNAPHLWATLDVLAAQLPLAELQELAARSEVARLPRVSAIIEAKELADIVSASRQQSLSPSFGAKENGVNAASQSVASPPKRAARKL